MLDDLEGADDVVDRSEPRGMRLDGLGEDRAARVLAREVRVEAGVARLGYVGAEAAMAAADIEDAVARRHVARRLQELEALRARARQLLVRADARVEGPVERRVASLEAEVEDRVPAPFEIRGVDAIEGVRGAEQHVAVAGARGEEGLVLGRDQVDAPAARQLVAGAEQGNQAEPEGQGGTQRAPAGRREPGTGQHHLKANLPEPVDDPTGQAPGLR